MTSENNPGNPDENSSVSTGRPEGIIVNSVIKSFDIIDALRELEHPTVSNISTHLDYSNSLVYKHLATLEENGYVIKEGQTYRPSLRFFEIGAELKTEWLKVYNPAQTALEELAEETGENCWLMIEEQGAGVMLSNIGGDNALEPGYFYEGKRADLYTSAAGKAILANLPEGRRTAIIERAELEPLTDRTLTDSDALRNELERIRSNGIAVNDEEAQSNIRAVGAPILDDDGTVLGAISVSGPTSRISGEYYETELPAMLREKTNIIEIMILSS